jgi:putative Ca2+/H+ antiporter (TMEM165/GDT1 family)
MRRILQQKRDVYAGLLMVVVGLATAFEASTYPLGTIALMGPGFFPTALGVILAIVGVMIMIAPSAPVEDDDVAAVAIKPDWRGWICILAGPTLFIVFGHYTGLLLATFACVFVSSFGDRTTTLKEAVILATAVTVCGVFLFSYVLQVNFPILRWHS